MHTPPAESQPHSAADAPVYMGLPHERYLRPRLWVSLALSVPVLVLAMGEMVAPSFFHQFNPATLAWAQLVLTTPVFFWAGAPLNRRWWYSIRERDTNMFTLIVTGTGAAYAFSVAATVFGDHFPPPSAPPTAPHSISKPWPSSRRSSSSGRSSNNAPTRAPTPPSGR
jgi:Cu+-exporting ATPase